MTRMPSTQNRRVVSICNLAGAYSPSPVQEEGMRLAASAGSSDGHGLSPADARGSGSAAVRGSRKRDAPSSDSGEAVSEIVARGAGRKKGRIGIAPEVTASVTAHTSSAELQAITDPLLRASGARGPSLVEIKEMNFYDALNVQPGATNAEIRRAFKAVALKYHPDKGGDPAIFRYLCTVRDILLNKAKREQYDFYGRDSFADAFSKQPPGGTGNVDANALPGQRVLFAPISDMLEKMAADEAWATQRWGQDDGGGYRFDVLAAVVLKRAEATGPPMRAWCDHSWYSEESLSQRSSI